MIDLDITELFEEIVKELPEGLEILYPNGKGGTKVMKSPRLNYIFGSSQYIKDMNTVSLLPSLKGSFHWLHYSLQLVRIEVMRIIFQKQRFR